MTPSVHVHRDAPAPESAGHEQPEDMVVVARRHDAGQPPADLGHVIALASRDPLTFGASGHHGHQVGSGPCGLIRKDVLARAAAHEHADRACIVLAGEPDLKARPHRAIRPSTPVLHNAHASVTAIAPQAPARA